MKDLSLLIKPVSGRCNLRCGYCFYLGHDATEEGAPKGRMSSAMLDALVSKAMAEAEDSVSFAFQGGEPTLAGLDFYREFLSLVSRYSRQNLRIALSIQTNGMLLDEEWADFLKANGFLVGLSLDGDAELHDGFRVTPAGKGTYPAVSRSLRLLARKDVDFNILCVVTGPSSRHAARLYRFFRKQGCRYLQFIPCLDPAGTERGGQASSLSPERYGRFLCELFDLWHDDWMAGEYISIRLFDDWVHALAGMPTGSCATTGRCGGYLVVEADGSAYPCDFYVADEWRLGNVRDASLATLSDSPAARKFRDESLEVPEACLECPYFAVCRCGCRRDRDSSSSRPPADNHYCSAFRTFFAYALPRLARIAAQERRAAGL